VSTRSLGRAGEESAALYLTENGYTVIARNVQMGHLEIDIIAGNETHILFAEVKTRRAYPGAKNRFGRPADAVDTKKRSRLLSAARLFMRENAHVCGERIPNIDVIEVYADPASETYRVLEIRHFRNAVNGMKS